MFRSNVKQNKGNNLTFGVTLLALEVMSIKFSLVLLRHYTCTKLKVTSETVENATQRAGVCLKEAVLQVHGLKKRQLIR